MKKNPGVLIIQRCFVPSMVEINQVFLKKMIKCEKFSTSKMIMTIGSGELKRLMPFISEYIASSFVESGAGVLEKVICKYS